MDPFIKRQSNPVDKSMWKNWWNMMEPNRLTIQFVCRPGHEVVRIPCVQVKIVPCAELGHEEGGEHLALCDCFLYSQRHRVRLTASPATNRAKTIPHSLKGWNHELWGGSYNARCFCRKPVLKRRKHWRDPSQMQEWAKHNCIDATCACMDLGTLGCRVRSAT